MVVTRSSFDPALFYDSFSPLRIYPSSMPCRPPNRRPSSSRPQTQSPAVRARPYPACFFSVAYPNPGVFLCSVCSGLTPVTVRYRGWFSAPARWFTRCNPYTCVILRQTPPLRSLSFQNKTFVLCLDLSAALLRLGNPPHVALFHARCKPQPGARLAVLAHHLTRVFYH